MPLPIVGAIAGYLTLPAAGSFLAGMAGSLMVYIAKFVSRNVAVNLATFTFVAFITTSFIGVILGMISVFNFFTPPEWDHAISLVVPDNSILSVGAIISAKALRWVWVWQFYAIEKLSGS